ncbi:MAG: ribonuclease T2 family protein [Phyllobacterium sp.]
MRPVPLGRIAWVATACLIIAYLAFEQAQETTPAIENAAAPQSNERAVADEGAFDFYVLALSWSPSYCASEGRNADPQQCGRGKPRGFVVHGLWPQFERGYPEYCDATSRDVPRSISNSLSDMMPSRGLAAYQWRKHGSCSGLDQKAYFDLLQAAYDKVKIPNRFQPGGKQDFISPKALEDALIVSNPGLPAQGVAVTCDKRYLREVRICMTKDLKFRKCADVDRQQCRQNKVLMPGAA